MAVNSVAPGDRRLLGVLSPAYEPCRNLVGACRDMRWSPERGHVPRGFVGALAGAGTVEVVLVCAEPGDPQADERHDAPTREAMLHSAAAFTYRSFRNGTDLFHRNVRYLLDQCFPEMPFEQQMRRTWITESVLCSAAREGGRVPAAATAACRQQYLARQLDLMPRAVLVALGAKARDRMRPLGRSMLVAVAAAPPGCNRPEARASWDAVGAEVRRRRGG